MREHSDDFDTSEFTGGGVAPGAAPDPAAPGRRVYGISSVRPVTEPGTTGPLVRPLLPVPGVVAAKAANPPLLTGGLAGQTVVSRVGAGGTIRPVAVIDTVPSGFKVDYVACTIPYSACADVMTVLGMLTPPSAAAEDWIAMPHGISGYTEGYLRGEIRVLYAGKPNMGIHVILSGTACTQLTEEFHLNEHTWILWLAALLGLGCNFARLDICKDDFSTTTGALSLDTMVKYLENGHYVSRSREWEFEKRIKGSKQRRDSEKSREILRLGSRTSNMFIRIYDKALQQNVSESFHWVRVECEFKNQKANELVQVLSDRGMGAMADILMTWLEFKDPPSGSEDQKVSRWGAAAWWSDFVRATGKQFLRTPRLAEATLASTKSWLRRQTAPAVAMIVDALYMDAEREQDKDGGRSRVMREFWGWVEEGRLRRKSKHRNLLNNYMPVRGVSEALAV